MPVKTVLLLSFILKDPVCEEPQNNVINILCLISRTRAENEFYQGLEFENSLHHVLQEETSL